MFSGLSDGGRAIATIEGMSEKMCYIAKAQILKEAVQTRGGYGSSGIDVICIKKE